MIDSKINTIFQITSILYSDGICDLSDVEFGVLMRTRSSRWYRYITLSFIPLLVFSHIFSQNGGRVIFRL